MKDLELKNEILLEMLAVAQLDNEKLTKIRQAAVQAAAQPTAPVAERVAKPQPSSTPATSSIAAAQQHACRKASSIAAAQQHACPKRAASPQPSSTPAAKQATETPQSTAGTGRPKAAHQWPCGLQRRKVTWGSIASSSSGGGSRGGGSRGGSGMRSGSNPADVGSVPKEAAQAEPVGEVAPQAA